MRNHGLEFKSPLRKFMKKNPHTRTIDGNIPVVNSMLRLLSSFHTIPYDWNPKTQLLSPVSSQTVYWSWVFLGPAILIVNGIGVLLHLGSAIYQAQGRDVIDPKVLQELAISVAFVATTIGIAKLQRNLVVDGDEVCKAWNELLRWRRELIRDGATLAPDFIHARYIPWGLLLRSMILVAAGISHPFDVPHLLAHFPQWADNRPMFYTWAFTYALTTWAAWSNFIFVFATALFFPRTYIEAASFILSNKKISLDKTLKQMKKAVLINRYYTNGFSQRIYPTYLLMTSTCFVFSFFVSVRCWGIMPLKLYIPVVIPVFGVPIFLKKLVAPNAQATVAWDAVRQKTIRQILEKGNQQGHGRMYTYLRNLKAMPQIRFRIGDFVFVKRHAYLFVLGTIVYYAITLLINY